MFLPIFILCIFLIETQAIHVSSRGRNQRIIGGEHGRAGQFSYVAAIYKQTSTGNYFCSGTILNRQWIVTAGQCVENAVQFNIRIGNNNLTSEVGLKVATDEYYLHPDYNPNTHEHNIGLIKLRMEITYGPYAHPIDYVDSESLPDGTIVTAAGWGATSDSETGLVDYIRFVDLVSISNEECRLYYGSQITDTMVCVSGNYNEGICRGDLGGGLVHRKPPSALRHLAGIANFISSYGCETTDPSGFTRIHPYVEWINQTIAAN